jgi:hypothetical protein
MTPDASIPDEGIVLLRVRQRRQGKGSAQDDDQLQCFQCLFLSSV